MVYFSPSNSIGLPSDLPSKDSGAGSYSETPLNLTKTHGYYVWPLPNGAHAPPRGGVASRWVARSTWLVLHGYKAASCSTCHGQQTYTGSKPVHIRTATCRKQSLLGSQTPPRGRIAWQCSTTLYTLIQKYRNHSGDPTNGVTNIMEMNMLLNTLLLN